jgi:hypothetical protein
MNNTPFGAFSISRLPPAATPALPAELGRITGTATAARTIQFGLQLDY